MFDLNQLVRSNIKSLTPYTSARDAYTGKRGVFLDANESPFGIYNRYPDPHQVDLKTAIAQIKHIDVTKVFLGNGSDEIIDLLFRIFCNPGHDKVLTFIPTYGMYEVSAGINNVEIINLPLTDTFQIDTESLTSVLEDKDIKLIFICSPNNPTGNLIHRETIAHILQHFHGVVIIDEAYADFSSAPSWLAELDKYPNLVIMQTLSKAWGLAGLRLGIAFTHPMIVDLLNKIKPPYNISVVNQRAALDALQSVEDLTRKIALILSERQRLIMQLSDIPLIKTIFPSDANFLLVQFADGDKVYNSLIEKGIIVRNRNKDVRNCLRITVGTSEENEMLINALKIL